MRRPGQAAAGPTPMRTGDILVTQLDVPVTLPPGSPARGLPCLECTGAIGGEPADAVMFLPASEDGCECGRVHACAFWAHAKCVTSDVDRLVTLAKQRLAYHEPPGGDLA